MADAISELRREIHRRGYDTRKTNDNHYEILTSEGELVRTKKGIPITIPSTPGGGRGMNNAVAVLRDAGVLPRPAQSTSPRQIKMKLDQDRLKQYCTVLRGELVALMADYNLRQVDVYQYADHYASQHGLPVPSNPQGVVSKFLKGTNLMNANYQWLSSAVGAIKANEGIPAMTTDVVPTPPEPKGIEVEGESRVKARKIPSLAFDAMRLMYQTDPNDVEIREVVDRIAALEMHDS